MYGSIKDIPYHWAGESPAHSGDFLGSELRHFLFLVHHGAKAAINIFRINKALSA